MTGFAPTPAQPEPQAPDPMPHVESNSLMLPFGNSRGQERFYLCADRRPRREAPAYTHPWPEHRPQMRLPNTVPASPHSGHLIAFFGFGGINCRSSANFIAA